MSMNLRVVEHLTLEQVEERERKCRVVDERLRWSAVRMKMTGWSAVKIAEACQKNPDWVRRTVRRYNKFGPDALADGRAKAAPRGRMLTREQESELAALVAGDAPDGGLWTGPKVARWMSDKVGRPVHRRTGWAYLRRLGFTLQVPRPTHPKSDPSKVEAFKKGASKKRFKGFIERIPTR